MTSKAMSYVSGISDTPLIGKTIGDLFDDTAAKYPNNDALISRHQSLRYTYKELQEEVNRCAKALLHMGVTKGERVGIWAPNCAEWCITQFATAKIGAILVNINPSYRTHELEYALKQSGASTMILQGAFKASHYVDMICELAPELRDSVASQFKSEKLPQMKHVVCMDEDLANEGMWTWSDLMSIHEKTTDAELSDLQSTLQFHDPINIQYTSGTTSAPKEPTTAPRNIMNNGL